MKKYLKDNIIFSIISSVADSLEQETYVIGGFVRDLIIKRETTDIDIVTVGSGIEMAKRVAKRINPKLKVAEFKNFGTAMFLYKNIEIEFVGARKESYYENSRNPLIETGTLEDDQKRRDFTINALAIGLNKNKWGKLIDPFHGIEDIKNKIIRTPLNPNITFSDDPLRMLRAIRFSTQLNFRIEENTLNAISLNKDRIKIISSERISEELNKIILSEKPSKGIKLLDKTGLIQIILPELYALKGRDTIKGISHKDNFQHSLEVLDNISKQTDNLWLRWAALLHDIAKPKTKKFIEGQGWTFYSHNFIGSKMIPKIFRRLKMPMNEKMKFVQKMVQLHMRPIVISEDVVTDSAVRRLLFEAGNDIDDLMLLCEADITSKNHEKVKNYLKNFKIVRLKLKEVEEKDSIRNFQPPISGDLIMKTFNLQPCKEVGIIKNAIKEAILDGEIQNEFNQAYEFMIKKGLEIGLIIKTVN